MFLGAFLVSTSAQVATQELPSGSAGSAAETTDNQFRLICAGMGFQNGYLDGFEIGLNDRLYRGQTDFKTHPLFEQGDRGFNEKWIYRVIYQMAFRQGFGRGYDDGFNRRENLVVNRFAQLEEALQGTPAEVPARRPAAQEGPVILPAGTLVLLQLNDYLTTKMNQRGDPFTALVVRDVFVGNALAIPAQTVVAGTVGQVTRPGRVSGKGEMTLRFDRLRYRNGTELALSATLSGIGEASLIDREGTFEGQDSHGRDAAVIAGGASAGTVVGVIAGGGKGAALGATIGGLIGLAGVLSTRGEDIELVKGTLLEIMLDQDLKVESSALARP